MALPGDEPQYGIVFSVTGVTAGSVCTVQRDTSAGFGTAITISQLTSDGSIQDLLPNDGVTRYYRAFLSKAGYVNSPNSSTISGEPVLLNGLA